MFNVTHFLSPSLAHMSSLFVSLERTCLPQVTIFHVKTGFPGSAGALSFSSSTTLSFSIPCRVMRKRSLMSTTSFLPFFSLVACTLNTESLRGPSVSSNLIILTYPPPPVSPEETKSTLSFLKSFKTAYRNYFSSIYLKYYGTYDITSIFIIPILKSNKNLSLPSSYKPISLLCTLSKVMEQILLPYLDLQIPHSPSQHSLRKSHSTPLS